MGDPKPTTVTGETKPWARKTQAERLAALETIMAAGAKKRRDDDPSMAKIDAELYDELGLPR